MLASLNSLLTTSEDVKSELESDKLKEHLSLEDDSASVVDILDDAKKELDQIKKSADN